MRLVLVFVAMAAIAAVVGDGRWLPLHLFLAGAVVLAISGVAPMLTVTWSAAPAPPEWASAAQRWGIALGAIGVVLGREEGIPALTETAGTVYMASLAGLAAILVVTARRGLERRFDPAVWAYLLAIASGLVGTGLGIVAATSATPSDVRGIHATANLVGLVGITAAGTLPFFAATVIRSKMSTRATRTRLAVHGGWLGCALLVAIVGLATHERQAAAGGFLVYALGVAAVFDAIPRPTRRQFTWAGPRLLGLWAAGGWWVITLLATAADASAGRPVLGGRWLVVLVVAGYGQILWASMAYLLPMLRGGGHVSLSEGFAVTRSWLGLAAVNLAGLAAALRLPSATVAVAISVWAVDSAWRASRIGTRRASRPADG